MTRPIHLAFACVVCLSSLGCQYGLRRDVLRQQASEELGCPPDEVTVTHGSEGYRASGCGEDVQYDCPDGPEDMTEYGDRSCTLVRRTVGLETAGGEAEEADADAEEGEGADATDDEADDETAAEGDVTQPQGEDGDGDDGDDDVVEGEAEDGDEEDEQDPEASGSEDTDGGPGSADAGAEEPQG